MDNVAEHTEELVEKIQEALDSKFSNYQRRKIHVLRDRINFACPICGDSHDDNRKKRGNIFFKTNSYKCYNCGVFFDIKGFLLELKKIGHVSGSIPQELMLSTTLDTGGGQLSATNLTFLFDGLEEAINEYGVDRDRFKKIMSLQEIEESEKLSYMRGRGFFEYERFLYSEYTQKLYVLNLDLASNKVLAFQTRQFQGYGPKYLTYKLEKAYEEMRLTAPVGNEVFDKLNELSIYFNLTNADINKPLTYLEGPIDAYLFKNGVSLTSLHTHPPFESDNTRFLFDFDPEGTKKAKAYLKQKKSMFMWRKFLKDYKIDWIEGGKIDFNDLITELRKKKEYKVDFNKYFSDNPMDLLWI